MLRFFASALALLLASCSLCKPGHWNELEADSEGIVLATLTGPTLGSPKSPEAIATEHCAVHGKKVRIYEDKRVEISSIWPYNFRCIGSYVRVRHYYCTEEGAN